MLLLDTYLIRAPPPVPAATTTPRRSGRSVRFPRRFDDHLPATRTPLAHVPSKETRGLPWEAVGAVSHPGTGDAPSPSAGIGPAAGCDADRDGSPAAPSISVETDSHHFGISRVFPQEPLRDPQETVSLGSLCDARTLAHSATHPDGIPGT
ncbi:hypothetical protein BJV78DRAFT_1353455 [Lactifluus subvellereus]|nr:hypothetical protein BJV78DRAFT_1353455 [Lactifluus subvellereus]